MKRQLIILAMAGLVFIPALAQENDLFREESLFEESEDSDDFLTVEENAQEAATGALELLATKSTRIGGDFSLSLGSSLSIREDSSIDELESTASLMSHLFLDARPTEDFRFFLSGDLSYPFERDGSQEPSFLITEAFSDVIVADALYTRTGKQTLTWGVGYFYSPADILNLGKIDPTDPEADLEGPVAVKLQLPIRTTNLYLITIVDDLFEGGSPGFAPKLEFVLGETEFSLGGYYQYQEPWAGMATVTTTFYDVNFFAEGVIQYGNTVKILQYNGPILEAVETPDTWYPYATAGFSYSYSDDDGFFDLFAAAQYYYNGQGYEDPNIFQDPQLALLLLNEELSAVDILEPGRHYLGFSLRWNEILGSDFDSNTFLQWNLTDRSSFLDSKISYNGIDHMNITLGYRQSFGEGTGQFTAILGDPQAYVELRIGAGTF